MITKKQIEEWQKLRRQGMTSAIGEYTPEEFWDVLDEITRLSAELEQAREQRNYFEGAWNRAIDAGIEFKKRAEAAEQQVAALVNKLSRMRMAFASVHFHYWRAHELPPVDKQLAAENILLECDDNLPDRAKKIQAVVEAAKNWKKTWGKHPETLNADQTDCNLYNSVCDLES